MKNKKVTNLITTGMMASALIFSYGGSAFANEDTTTTEPTQIVAEVSAPESTVETTIDVSTEVVSDVTTTETTQDEATEIPSDETEETTTEATVTEETTTADTTTVETDEQLEEEAPALVPGDFFYFVKTFIEKIRLAVTLDDYKEAQLLADFATERIAEANALIAEGKTEEASKMLQEAIATQEAASEVLDGTTEEATEDATQEDVEEVTDETTEETSVTTEETVQVDEPIVDEEVIAVESKLGNNIIALVAAVEKIDNPRAQAALMKNIEKSFAKLSKKIQKLEMKNGTEEVVAEEVTTEEVANVEAENQENTTEATAENNVEAEGTVTTEDQEVADAEVKEETTTVVAPVKSVKTENTHKESVHAKVEAKQQQVQAKVAEKKNQVQVKVEEKKQAGQAKAEEKKNENAKKDKE